jgi:O-Antigen ligase
MWATATHRVGVLIVGIALVYATVAQGAFAADQAAVVIALVGVAAALALAGRRATPRFVVVAVALLVALAVWTAARAAGGPAAAVWAGLPILAVAAAAVAVAGLAARARTVLTAVVIAAGLSVAVTGWAGVAWHIEPLALVSSGLWRASSTLTYANASASFLVTTLFVTASAAGRLGPRRARLVTAALLVGLLATMSRAGLLALALGLLVAVAVSASRRSAGAPPVWRSLRLAAAPTTPSSVGALATSSSRRSAGVWRGLARLWPAVPGAAVAAAGLLPGLTEESAPHPLVAVVALAAGLGLAAFVPHRPAAPGTARRTSAVAVAVGPTLGSAMRPAMGTSRLVRRRVLVAAAVVAVALAAAPLAVGERAGAGAVVGALVTTRLSADSPERADLRRVTAAQFAAAPLTGVGPGRLDLVYVDYLGRLVVAEYTHDEFLQTAAETGLVGVGLAVAVFACLGAAAFRRRHTAGGPFAAAILAAFAAHSTFDFLWHIPVLPLLVMAAVVPLLDHPSYQEEEVTR